MTTILLCDKGAGKIILNICDYMDACYNHLEDTQNNKPYYSKFNYDLFEKAKDDIQFLLVFNHQ